MLKGNQPSTTGHVSLASGERYYTFLFFWCFYFSWKPLIGFNLLVYVVIQATASGEEGMSLFLFDTTQLWLLLMSLNNCSL